VHAGRLWSFFLLTLVQLLELWIIFNERNLFDGMQFSNDEAMEEHDMVTCVP